MYAIIDIETTGGNARYEKITEIAIYIHDGSQVVKEFTSLINPERTIPPYITRLTGISNEMVADAPKFYEVAKEIVMMTEGTTIVAHNAHFDYGFMREEFKSLGYHFVRSTLCTVKLSRKLMPGHSSYSLGNLCARLGIKNESRHRAAGDAFATTQLFDVLLSHDVEGLLSKSIKMDLSTLRLPPNLEKEEVDKLPEEVGVYYFHDSDGNIIYIGKSLNIRKRVFSHFAAKDSAKGLTMKDHITSITFEPTGSELVALLLESDEIKKHKPKFNRAQKETAFQYGIYTHTNADGYITLKYGRVKNNKDEQEPVLMLRNIAQATQVLEKACSRHKLCPKLCSLYHIEHSCLNYHAGICKGACIGKESPEEYNLRVMQLLRKWRFENESFFIIGDGRTLKEKSIVAVEAGRYVGFGFVDNEFKVGSPDQLKFFINKYSDNRDVQNIIQRHIDSQHRDKILKY